MIQALRVSIFVIVFCSFVGCGSKEEQQELRVLAWVGYEEAEIVEPFQNEFGITVKTETFTGADKMFAKLSRIKSASNELR